MTEVLSVNNHVALPALLYLYPVKFFLAVTLKHLLFVCFDMSSLPELKCM